jgi:uncharacterized protein YndB with AHSA1/START domain
MTSDRRIEVEAEVPASPEEVWDAIATGPGISAWFMPAEVDGRVGGPVVHRHDGETATTGTITAYDRPHRFGYEERSGEFLPEGGPQVTATEFLVEARGGGTCAVRVVMSGFGDGDAWDRAIESFTAGWRQALGSLRLYLTHFRGQPVASVAAGTMVGGVGWQRFARALGLPAQPAEGDRLATGPDTPALAGTVEQVGAGMVTLLLERPHRGIGLVGAGGAGDETFLTVRAQLFGPDAAAVADREQRAWTDWFHRQPA